jgi:hypothetical protein
MGSITHLDGSVSAGLVCGRENVCSIRAGLVSALARQVQPSDNPGADPIFCGRF